MTAAARGPAHAPGRGVDEPGAVADERTALQAFLDRQRELVAWKVADCEAVVLQRATTASGLTPLGIVQHLVDVERSWWRERVVGEPGLAFAWSEADPDADFRVHPETSTARALAAYEQEWRTCNSAIAGLALDHVGPGTRFSVRWVYLHLIEETSRHLGQLDLLREQADGAVGEEPRA